MNDQALGTDTQDFGEMVAEVRSQFEEPITIRRFASQTTAPGAFLTQLPSTFTDVSATALVVSMDVAAQHFAAGSFSAGDLVLEMTDQLNEGSNNIGGAVVADRVIYRGMEYRMVQRPIPISLGAGLSPDVPFWIVHLRRTNSTADTVGG